VVGIVANLRPVKDIPFFLDAAAVVAAEILDAAFLVVGTGPLKPQLKRTQFSWAFGKECISPGAWTTSPNCCRTSRWAVSPRWLKGFRTPFWSIWLRGSRCWRRLSVGTRRPSCTASRVIWSRTGMSPSLRNNIVGLLRGRRQPESHGPARPGQVPRAFRRPGDGTRTPADSRLHYRLVGPLPSLDGEKLAAPGLGARPMNFRTSSRNKPTNMLAQTRRHSGP